MDRRADTDDDTMQRPRSFGSALRHWRRVRRFSQLDLAEHAGISSRHLSFLETGRAQPSREMIGVVAAALDLPLDARNALHVAAGFTPPHGDRDLAAGDIAHVRRALDFMLAQQEPFPGLVIDGGWDVRMRNGAAERIFAPFRSAYDMEPALAGNAMHVVFHPRGLRPFLVNWREFAAQMLLILQREAAQGFQRARLLHDTVVRYPGVAALAEMTGAAVPSTPVLTMRLAKGDLRLAFFSTFSSLVMPSDAALQALKIEGFYPADDATAEHARVRAQQRSERP